RIDPFLISDSDLRIKSCKELSECRWFTEVMFGSAKGWRWHPAHNAIASVQPSPWGRREHVNRMADSALT
ncbi:hypothetical protein, partial [Xanthomonas phaseoli]